MLGLIALSIGFVGLIIAMVKLLMSWIEKGNHTLQNHEEHYRGKTRDMFENIWRQFDAHHESPVCQVITVDDYPDFSVAQNCDITGKITIVVEIPIEWAGVPEKYVSHLKEDNYFHFTEDTQRKDVEDFVEAYLHDCDLFYDNDTELDYKIEIIWQSF